MTHVSGKADNCLPEREMDLCLHPTHCQAAETDGLTSVAKYTLRSYLDLSAVVLSCIGQGSAPPRWGGSKVIVACGQPTRSSRAVGG